jgi:hypothetical protein
MRTTTTSDEQKTHLGLVDGQGRLLEDEPLEFPYPACKRPVLLHADLPAPHRLTQAHHAARIRVSIRRPADARVRAGVGRPGRRGGREAREGRVVAGIGQVCVVHLPAGRRLGR